MKRFGFWGLHAAAVAGMLLASSAVWSVAWVSADPTDDLSFSLQDEQRHHRAVMTPLQVEQVFLDRLKDYPITQRRRLALELVRLCKSRSFDPAFVLALISVESGFRTKVTSSAGAIGLMQLMPETAKFVAERYGIEYRGKKSLYDPLVNLRLGMAYLADLRVQFPDRSHFFLLAAYNMGPYALKKRLSAGSFKPVHTLKYYQQIRRAVPEFRYYQLLALGKSQNV